MSDKDFSFDTNQRIGSIHGFTTEGDTPFVIIGHDGEKLYQRADGHITANSVTGVGPGAAQFELPPLPTPPTKKKLPCCVVREKVCNRRTVGGWCGIMRARPC